MTVNDFLRLAAGTMVLLSAALTYFVNPLWILLTVFVGLNLFQSAFTKWCPLITILRKLGVSDPEHDALTGHGKIYCVKK